MKRHVAAFILGTLTIAAAWAMEGSPMISTVEPDTGKQGDVVSAKGESLDKSSVSDIYLTDGKNDVKASIVEQSAKEIKFKIPAEKAGRYHVMVLTANKTSMMVEPVMITVQ